MHIDIPGHVTQILRSLNRAGYEAYVVGGCVRDSILNRTPSDWDITTSALPMEVKAVFKRTVDTGIEHGTVTVLSGGSAVEVTTYRIDGKYEDGRHPKQVTFTPSLEEDLKRRDFTINAMAYNDEEGLVDLFDGTGDLERGMIRAVGDPVMRFTEDALRMMRAVRFAGQLGFDIDEETLKAIEKLHENLRLISPERIQTELVKLVTGMYPDRMRQMYKTGLTAVFLPEFDTAMETQQNTPHHYLSVGEHTMRGMELAPSDKVIRLTMLFHDLGKPGAKTTDENGRDHFHGHPQISAMIAKRRLKELRFDNATSDDVAILTEYHDIRIRPEEKNVRRVLAKLGRRRFEMLLLIQKADILAQSDYLRKEKLSDLSAVENIFSEITQKGDCISIKELAIDGNDLMELGFVKGPALGKELSSLLDMVLDDPGLNDKHRLLEIAKEDLAKIEQIS
ncbi:MAG: CCA tRNA nucleotidyltransferase [Lachnospiraceae bacterium]|nr:CCA tRNA nucleotidyltransferase [Lachnospiraceae bacterium]